MNRRGFLGVAAGAVAGLLGWKSLPIASPVMQYGPVLLHYKLDSSQTFLDGDGLVVQRFSGEFRFLKGSVHSFEEMNREIGKYAFEVPKGYWRCWRTELYTSDFTQARFEMCFKQVV